MIAYLKRLFGIGTSAEASTAPLDATLAGTSQLATAPLQSSEPPTPAAGGAAPLRVAHAQSVGVVRDHNEDVLLTVTGTFEGDERIPTFGLYVVADGMGGHNMGERASAVAARSVACDMIKQVYLNLLTLNPDDRESRPPLQEILGEAIAAANRAVISSVGEGGTTATVALVIDDQAIIGHVGDSRAYIIAPTGIEQLTRDHSLVRRLQELGQLSADEAAVHPQRNVLYRAIGQGEGLEVDVHSHRLSPGMKIMMCSDGMWGLVSDAKILEIVYSSPNLQTACNRLVDAANQAGGHDNITAVLVEYNPSAP